MEQHRLEFLGRHRGKVIGVCIGLAFGWFAITYGFWKAIFVSICIGVGYFIGKRLDERINWTQFWDRLFRKD